MPQAQYQFLLDLANTQFQDDLVARGLAAQGQPSAYDITDRVMEASVRRGRDNELDPFGPGSMTLLLDNTDWRFTPDYGGSPLYGKLRPGAMVTARVPVPDYTNLVSWWTLDEAAASTRYDSHGTNHLSPTSGGVGRVDGTVGGAASFSYLTSECLSVASNASLQVGDIDFSICFWLYLPTNRAASADIISKWDGATNCQWDILHNGLNLYFYVSSDGTVGATTQVQCTTALLPNTWNFVTCFHDSANNIIGISVNNGTFDTKAYSAGVYASGTASLTIGGTNGVGDFTGYIDSVSFWKKVLQPYYVPSGLLTSLVSYWKLDEASGTRVDSVTATGNDLTDNNTVTQNPGIISNAAQFTKANSEWLSRADNTSLSTGDIDFTFACWVYLDSLPAAVYYPGIISKSALNAREYSLISDGDNGGRFNFQVTPNGTTYTSLYATAFGIPPLSTWIFVVCWHDSVANTINIQVNNGTVNSTAHTTGVLDGTSDFNIGRLNAGAISYHNGRIDEVGFWKRVLTATERANLYNAGAGVTYPFTTVP